MEIDVELENIKTVTIHLRTRGKYKNATLTVPPDLVTREELVDGEDVVIAFIKKAKKKKTE